MQKIIESRRFGCPKQPSIIGFLGNFFQNVLGTEAKDRRKSTLEIQHEKISEQSLNSAVNTLGEMALYNKKMSRSLSLSRMAVDHSDSQPTIEPTGGDISTVSGEQQAVQSLCLPSLSQIMSIHNELVLSDHLKLME